MRKLSEKQRDQIKGVFFGQAIGDALGLGTEFMSRQEVEEHYPDGLERYEQIIQDAHRCRWECGDWTDDTDQFLCICDAIVDTKGVDEHSFAKHLYAWFSGVPMGIGDTVRKVLSMPGFVKESHKAAALVWKMSGGKNASNGAIMRSAILGTFEFWDRERVKHNSSCIAKVTHADVRVIDSCVLINYLIAECLMTGKVLSYDEVRIIANEMDKAVMPFVESSVQGNISQLQLDEEATMGYTLKTMSAGLWVYWHAKDFEEGVLSVVNQGGDADTNGAVAGALLGAKYGYSTIPIQWIEGLKEKNLLEEKYEMYLAVLEQI